LEPKGIRWLPVAVLSAAVLGLVLTQSILATPVAAEIAWPRPGATVHGIVQIRGSAAHDDLAYYQLAYSSDGRVWTSIGPARNLNPVHNGLLATWDTSSLPPGRYRLRLELVDRLGNRERQEVEVVVAAGVQFQ